MSKEAVLNSWTQMRFAPFFAFFIHFCIFNAAALAQNANELILYELANFEGESVVLKLGSNENYKAANNLRDYHHNLMNGVSSFKVGSNVKVLFFRGEYLYDGYHRDFGADESIRDLNHFNLNDDIESLILFKKDLDAPPGLMLYKDPGFSGTNLFLPSNKGYSQLVFRSRKLSNKINDEVSSLKLVGGVRRAFLYENECFEGRVLKVTSTVANLKDKNFDDTISSAGVGNFCATQPQHIREPCWLTKPPLLNIERDADLLVRTVNVHGSQPCLTKRLLGIARLFHQEFPRSLGVIGMQEMRDVEDCQESEHIVSSARCLAATLRQLYGIESNSNSVRGKNGIVAGEPWRIVESKFWELGTKWWNLESLQKCPKNAWPSHRYLLENKLVHSTKGWILRFYCTHLTLSSPCERLEQAKKVAALIRERAKPGELPPVMVGDFNAVRYFTAAVQPEESVLEMEKYFYRPTDHACGQSNTGKDMIYVGKKSAFPDSRGHYVPIRIHPVYFHGLQTRIDGFPNFCDELTDHHSNGVSFKILP